MFNFISGSGSGDARPGFGVRPALALAMGLLCSALTFGCAESDPSTAGTLDAAFGKGSADGTPDGVVGLSLGAGNDVGNAVAVQADGKLVVAGTNTAADGSTNIAVARFNTDGSLDATFGAGTADGTPDGVVSVSLGAGNDVAHAIAIQADGKILVAGTTTANDGSLNIAVARLSTTGALDAAFGAGTADGTPDGVVGISLGAGNDVVNAIALQADGRILLVGTTTGSDSTTNVAVARLTISGALDATFGAGTADGTPDGVVGISLSTGNDAASAIAVQADGRILVAGTTTAADRSTNVAVVRLTSTGALDAAFGAGTADGTPDGVVSVSFGNGNDVANAIALQADGKILIVGSHTASDGSTNIAVARLSTAGDLDASFGAGTADGTPDGVVSVSLGTGNDVARALAVQSDGRIVIAGYTTASDNSANIAVARLNTNGSLDSSFGEGSADSTPDGVAAFSLGSGNDYAKAVALQADGRIVVVGDRVNGASSDIVVLRLLAS